MAGRHRRHGDGQPIRPIDTKRWHGLERSAPDGLGLTVPELAAFLAAAQAEAARAGASLDTTEPVVMINGNGGVRHIWVQIRPRR